MIIGIPFLFQGMGGTRTFINHLKKELKKRKIEVKDTITQDCDVGLIVGSAPLRDVKQWKKWGVKIIQRLDGVYYFRVKGFGYPLWNWKMKKIHNHFADYIIYQSEFSKILCERFLGRSGAPFKIICNGTDLEKFSPTGEKIEFRDWPEQLIFVTSGRIRRKDMILPLLKGMDLLYEKRKDFKWVILGEIAPSIERYVKKYRLKPFLQFLKWIGNDEIAKYLRGGDIFLFSDNSACPNSIIEAMACGLVVTAFDRGGVRELVPSMPGTLTQHSSKEWWREKPFDLEKFCENIELILSDLNYYKSMAREEAEKRFSLEAMVNEYLKVFEQVISKKDKT